MNDASMNRTSMKSTSMNKKFRPIMIGALCGIAVHAGSVLAADVGVSIGIGEPGYYGRIDIDDAPSPRFLYAEPIVVEQVNVIEEPLYLRVPHDHAKNWRHYCHQYNACRQRTYFVEDDWYNTVYVPHHRNRGGHQRSHDNPARDRGHDNKGHDHDRQDKHGKGHREHGR